MGRERITSFTQLGETLGHTPPAPATEQQGRNFYDLPALEQLQICASNAERRRPRGAQRERRVAAINAALDIPKAKRKNLRIRTIALADLDKDGTLRSHDPQTSAFKIYTIFPATEHSGLKFLSARDLDLVEDTDETKGDLLQKSDKVHPETTYDRFSRLILNIKSIDASISAQKKRVHQSSYTMNYAPIERQVSTRHVSHEMDRLNRVKTELSYDFLVTALAMEEEYPELSSLFTIVGSPVDSLHNQITAWQPTEIGVLSRLKQGSQPKLEDEQNAIASFIINIDALRGQHERFETSPEAATATDAVGHEMYTLLLSSRMQGREERITRESQSESVDSFLKLPFSEQFGHAVKAVEARGPEDKFSQKMRNIAMRSLIDTEAKDRPGSRIVFFSPTGAGDSYAQEKIAVVAPVDGNKKFLQATMGDLVAPHKDDLAAVTSDEWTAFTTRVQKVAEMREEQSIDRYQRHLHELTYIDTAIQRSVAESNTEAAVFWQGKKTETLLSAVEVSEEVSEGYPDTTLYEVANENDTVTFAFYPLGVGNMLHYLLNPKGKRMLTLQKHPTAIQVGLADLYADKAAFDAGNETEVTGAAVILTEKLEEQGIY